MNENLNYQTWRLSPGFSFFIDHSREEIKLSDVLRDQIEAIWDKEKLQKKHLFNGQVLSLVSCDPDRIIAKFIEYKLFLAYIREPELRSKLNIKPLSISCMTFCSEKVLFGRRSGIGVQYPLWYELAPSGGIDSDALVGEIIDVLDQAKRELFEETGLAPTDIDSIAPMEVVFDADSGMYEICIKIAILPTHEDELLDHTSEYDELVWISQSELIAFRQKHLGNIVPLSLFLLDHFK